MNLARFGLLKDEDKKIIPSGQSELVEVSEQEALATSSETYRVDSDQELFSTALSLGAKISPKLYKSLHSSESFRTMDSSASVLVPPRRRRRYVKHEKKTSKEFVEKTKKQQGLFDFDTSILQMGPKDLLRYFPKKNSSKVLDKNHFARNVVWHYYREIMAGRIPDFAVEGCNMRTIFYVLKPILTQNKVFTDNGEKEERERKRDPNDVSSFYGNFTKAVQDLVIAGLISYKDFNIIDDRKVFRFMPHADFNTNVILISEKKAFAGRFAAYGSRYGVISQVTQGRSTILMTDTILTEMFEANYDLSKTLTILSFCDFDPVGTSIPIHFVKHLKMLGFHNINEFTQYGDGVMNRETGTRKDKDGKERPVYKKIHQRRPCLDIVNPHDFDAATRREMRHILQANIRDNPSTADWAFITGGVTGTHRNTTYAISSEQLLPYLNEHLDKNIRKLLEKPPEAVGRDSSYKALRKALREYIGARAELEATNPKS